MKVTVLLSCLFVCVCSNTHEDFSVRFAQRGVCRLGGGAWTLHFPPKTNWTADSYCAMMNRTTWYSACCETHHTKVKWPLIITGTPRSGTVYAQTLFRAFNLSVSKDWERNGPFEDGVVSWIHLFASKNDAYYGPLRLHGGRFQTLIHQVRELLSSITSLTCTEPLTSRSYQTYVSKHIPFDVKKYKNNKFALGMQMWVGWHKVLSRLDGVGAYRYKIEDLSGKNGQIAQMAVISAVYTLINRSDVPTKEHVAHTISKLNHTNSRRHRKTVSWNDLFNADASLALEAWQLGKTFGYVYDFDPSEFKSTTPPPTC
jgi:hypothetical protein